MRIAENPAVKSPKSIGVSLFTGTAAQTQGLRPVSGSVRAQRQTEEKNALRMPESSKDSLLKLGKRALQQDK